MSGILRLWQPWRPLERQHLALLRENLTLVEGVVGIDATPYLPVPEIFAGPRSEHTTMEVKSDTDLK